MDPEPVLMETKETCPLQPLSPPCFDLCNSRLTEEHEDPSPNWRQLCWLVTQPHPADRPPVGQPELPIEIYETNFSGMH